MNKRHLPNGITQHVKGYLAEYNNENLGTFKTLEEAYKVYKDHEFNLLDNSNKNEQEKQPSENNVGMPTEIEKASNAVQAVEHN